MSHQIHRIFENNFDHLNEFPRFLESIPGTAPYSVNETLSTDDPINVKQYLERHESELQTKPKAMFRDESKTNVMWHGPGTFEIFNRNHETFLWQWRSNGKISCDQKTKTLPVNSSILVPKNVRLLLVNDNPDCLTLSVAMPLPD